jgi:hypothetical protein
MPTDDIPPGRVPDRWTLIRDATVFQFKLVVDGLRDLLLVPASIVAALISLVDNEDGKPGGQFYRMIAIGKQSERMINLFGAYENAPEDVKREYDFGDMSLDDVVERMESFVVDEYKKGGVTAQAKARLDKVIDAMQKSSREP